MRKSKRLELKNGDLITFKKPRLVTTLHSDLVCIIALKVDVQYIGKFFCLSKIINEKLLNVYPLQKYIRYVIQSRDINNQYTHYKNTMYHITKTLSVTKSKKLQLHLAAYLAYSTCYCFILNTKKYNYLVDLLLESNKIDITILLLFICLSINYTQRNNILDCEFYYPANPTLQAYLLENGYNTKIFDMIITKDPDFIQDLFSIDEANQSVSKDKIVINIIRYDIGLDYNKLVLKSNYNFTHCISKTKDYIKYIKYYNAYLKN